MVDPLKLGEGAAQGGVEGWVTDAFRALDLFTSIRGGFRAVGRLEGATFKTLKRYGQKIAPQNVLTFREKVAWRTVLKDRYAAGVRAVDPLTGMGSRLAAEQGILPKPLTVGGKSRWGTTEALEKFGGFDDMKILNTYRSDADLAFVWDRQRGRYLTETEVQKEIIAPINARLPKHMHIQHGAHFNAWEGSAGKGTLNWENYGKKPGNPGPVALMDGRGEIKMMSAKQMKAQALRDGLPWHPYWDKVESLWLPAAIEMSRTAVKSMLLKQLYQD